MGSLVSFFVRPGSVVCAGAFLLAYAYRDGPLSSKPSSPPQRYLTDEELRQLLTNRVPWDGTKNQKKKKRRVNLTRKIEQSSVPSRVSRHTASYEPVDSSSSQSEEEDL